MATGNPALPIRPPGVPVDRWVLSYTDGLHWTTPQQLGGGGFSGSGGANFAAANGELAASFRATSGAACSFFVGAGAPCTVFQTSTNSGATWTRHPVPVPSNSTGSVLLAADPTEAGHFTVVVMNSTGTAFLSYTTDDNGNTWVAGDTLSDDTSTTKFKTAINYSPNGVLGLMWRSNVSSPGGRYDVFAAISNDQGHTFSKPLKVNATPSEAPDPTFYGNASDDFSSIALSKQAAFIGWAHWPAPGGVANRAGYFSSVKLQAFGN